MVRWSFGFIVMGLLAALFCAGALASVSTFDAALKADGTTLGQATGTLDITPAPDGRIAWKLSGGRFSPATVPGSSVAWDDDNLTGSGTAVAAEKVTIKEFGITVKQSSGVDISYRFRLTATVEDGKASAIALEQLP